ncbi:unnamed protein product [Nesidiocoris tenuis]|uniref:Uncharacterized protein n=2 Tax=Nesidiocoris tenuis TaxID=355587 RepID=A0A6H5HDK2_9HEMI|nr:unnamed protein product [Nesidiocoris tenuis]CAB0015333.1 unnamed protein product [Nesidiocoris tenuis]CAB0015785.1 unnamed protein product [Nesidiocoris tenuis]CAB0020872.1 unnamed protein product [Nesidiocoris tenuis]
MSRLFTLSSTESLMSATIFPPIELDVNAEYGIGLRTFMSYNTISNIKKDITDHFHIFGDEAITFPAGTYGTEEIFEFIEKRVEETRIARDLPPEKHNIKFSVDSSTGHVRFIATFDVSMMEDNSIGPLLGFTQKVLLLKDMTHTAPSPVNIFNYNSINIECNLLASDSYFNSSPSTILHSFNPDVDINYRIIHSPSPIVYLRINRNVIDFIQLRVVDERGSLLDFRKENITIVLELIRLQ